MVREKKCPDCPRFPKWMTTFSDLMSLLLTFFILLLSFSSVNEEDFENALGALQGALGVLAGEPILTSPVKLNVPIVHGDITEARPTLHDLATEEGEHRHSEGQERNEARQKAVEVVQGEGEVTIRIHNSVLFESGEAEVKPTFRPLLKRIGDVLGCIPNEVVIEGHTDDVPIHNPRYPNNHWLSSARALEVMDQMITEAHVPEGRFAAIGYGEFRPLQSNDTPAGRAANRRVEIRVLYDKARPDDASVEMVKDLLEKADIEDSSAAD